MPLLVVTGASGFLGMHAMRYLRDAGIQVKALCRTGGRILPDSIVIEPMDFQSIARAMLGATAVVHLAGLAHVASSGRNALDDEFRRVNIDHALCVGRAAALVGATMVFVSSAGVLGDRSPAGGLTDDSVPAPYDTYTRSKLEAERQLQRLASEFGLGLVIVRPPLVIGPNAPGNYGRILRMVGRWPLPVGSLHEKRSVIGARNLAGYLFRAATDVRCKGRTMLLCEPAPLSLPEMVTMIAKIRRVKYPMISVPQPLLRSALRLIGRSADALRLFNSFVLVPSVAPIELGWRPLYSTAEEFEWSARAPTEGGY
jgi:nucleoside-diphosphate-sugar epimerase